MKNYSIVRIGNEYVVQADDKSVLKVASRRRAAQLITNAAELLNSQPPPRPDAEPSIAADLGIIPDPGAISDPRVMPDAGVIPDPSEVS